MWHTPTEPMKSFVSRMQSFEGKDGILSVSLGHGFPWGDVPESGAKLWVVADRDIEKAHALAAQLGRERSEEHTSELQSLMRISYAVFCLKKKKKTTHNTH